MNSRIPRAPSARAHLAIPANKGPGRRPANSPADSAKAGIPRTHRRASEIIDAAAHVFAKLGYHGASTQDIADVLGIRQASLYYYFPSKDAALEIVCVRAVEDYFKAAGEIARGPGTATEKLTGLIFAHIAPIMDRGDFVKVFITQRHFLTSKSRRRIGKWSRGIERLFEKVIREGIRQGEFRSDANPRLVTLGILGAMNGVASWYGKEQVSIDGISKEFASMILDGLKSNNTRRR